MTTICMLYSKERESMLKERAISIGIVCARFKIQIAQNFPLYHYTSY